MWTIDPEHLPKWFKAIFPGAKRRRVFWYWRGRGFEEEACCEKETTQGWGESNRPYRADPLDQNQKVRLCTTSAVGLKTPRQLLHLMWWNNIRMLGMRDRQEHLNCKVQDFKDQGNNFEYTERLTKTRTGWPKSKTQVQQKDISRNRRWKRALCFNKVPQPQTRGNRLILFAADRQPEKKHLVQEAAHEEGRPGKHNETNGRESRDKKRR